MLNPIDRIIFWTGIMRDHSEFFLLSLSSRETEMVQAAQYFKSKFTEIHDYVKSLRSEATLNTFVNNFIPFLDSFIDYNRLALRRLMKCGIELNLPPTFVNHMINEEMEFRRELNAIPAGDALTPLAQNILMHKIWLPDASGHAASIASDLDPVEISWIRQANEFKKAFEDLFFKANELGAQLERSGLADGAMEFFNSEVETKLTEFICFLSRIRELREKCKLLGFLVPLIPDHMIREENFYIENLKSLQK